MECRELRERRGRMERRGARDYQVAQVYQVIAHIHLLGDILYMLVVELIVLTIITIHFGEVR